MPATTLIIPPPLATQLGLTSGIGGEEQGVVDGTFDGAVQNLYSPEFAVRQQGSQTLRDMVDSANVTILCEVRDALELLINTTESPEVRERAESLLARADARIAKYQTLVILYNTLNPINE